MRRQQRSSDILQAQPGSLYPALHRLEHQMWIGSKWSETDAGRQAKYSSLTRAGRAQFGKQTEQWQRFSGTVASLLEVA